MTSSYTILLLSQVKIHSTIVFISQDLVYLNHITSNTSIFKSWLSLQLTGKHMHHVCKVENDTGTGESPAQYIHVSVGSPQPVPAPFAHLLHAAPISCYREFCPRQLCNSPPRHYQFPTSFRFLP